MFLVFEGIDGSGKSTQARALAPLITDLTGNETLVTHEPWLEDTLKMAAVWDDMPVMVLEEFVHDRNHHVHEEIIPALESGKNVVCDRYVFSSWVYQVKGLFHRHKHLDTNWRRHLSWCPVPNLTVILDIDADIASKRLTARGENPDPDKLVKQRWDFQLLVTDPPVPWRIVQVDGERPELLVTSEILQHIKAIL